MRIAAILTTLALWASSAAAQVQCLAYEQFRDSMIVNGIQLIAQGNTTAPNGEPARVELWKAQDNTWALIGIVNDTIACVIQSGTDYSEPPTL